MNDGHRGKSDRSRRWWRAWMAWMQDAQREVDSAQDSDSASGSASAAWVIAMAASLAGAATAEAQVATEEVPERATAPRLVDVMTAEKPFAQAALGMSHRGELLAAVELTIGEIAALGVGYDDRLMAGATADEAEVQGRRSAWFRMNVPAGHWARWQPALDLTFQRTQGEGDEQAAELRGTATKSWRASSFGVIDLTGGVAVWEVAARGGATSVRLSDRALGERVRPFAGVAWTPPSYPRTSLLLEGSFGPTVLGGQPRLDWRLGWGARYQVLSWSTIDLVVRNRQDAGLAGSTVMVRLTAVLD